MKNFGNPFMPMPLHDAFYEDPNSPYAPVPEDGQSVRTPHYTPENLFNLRNKSGMTTDDPAAVNNYNDPRMIHDWGIEQLNRPRMLMPEFDIEPLKSIFNQTQRNKINRPLSGPRPSLLSPEERHYLMGKSRGIMQ